MSVNAENQTTAEVANKPSEIEQNEVNPLAENANETQKLTHLEDEIKQKDAILSTLKARVAQLEKEVSEGLKFKAQHSKESEEVAVLKAKSEDTLTRAKDIIFEKTKVIKNQELQIEALNQQIESLKEVISITKDLLEIRNLEVKQLETKIQCMDDKYKAEKERYDLMHKKLETMIRFNGDLKREYETQLCLFSALRERYNERELARGVVNEARSAASTAASTVASIAANTAPTNAASTVANTAPTNAASTVANTAPTTAAVSASTNASTSTNGEASSNGLNGEQLPDENK